MISVDLITGFLGSGKTTFIINYAKYLLKKGLRIAIIENDYGAINVDRLILQHAFGDAFGESVRLEMVIGGGDEDCHRRRLKTKLITMAMTGYDYVLVEPSGVFDVDEFFDLLYEDPLERWYQVGNVFSIVDMKLERDLSEASRYILASQMACAGRIVLSRAAGADEKEIAKTIEFLNSCLADIRCNRLLKESDIFAKDWEQMEDGDYEKLFSGGYKGYDFVKQRFVDEGEYGSLFFFHVQMTEEQVRAAVEKIFSDEKCGRIFRIKGYLPREEGWMELNATRHEIHIRYSPIGQEVMIVIGERLKEEEVGKYFEA